MDRVLYSEKEIAIFKGVMALMEEGMNPYSIKVSDIAKEADVGKGTIYDYFTSKEEAISHAILYKINGEVEAAFARIKGKDGFREKFYEVLHIIAECVDNNISTFRMLLSFGGIQEFYEYLWDYKSHLFEYIFKLNSILDHLLDVGLEEGVIDGEEDYYYRNMAIASSILGFTRYFHQKKLICDTDVEKAKAAAYKLLIKALK